MSEFYTLGNESWGKCILPEPILQIAKHCVTDGVAYFNPMGYVVFRYKNNSIPDKVKLNIHVESKYLVDQIKDLLKKRKERRMEYDLKSLQCVSDGEYSYYIKRIDWWAFHTKRITRVMISNE